jgi:hypothetical protein
MHGKKSYFVCHIVLAAAVVFGLVVVATQSAQAQTFNVLYTFTGKKGGGSPVGQLIFDSSGNLYGAAELGNGVDTDCPNSYCGAVFELTPGTGGWTDIPLHDFDLFGQDAANPGAGLAFDSHGQLYGTTIDGGGDRNQVCFRGCGSVFQLVRDGQGKWKMHLIHKFTGGSDGGKPQASLVLDSSGNIYGTTTAGGDVTHCGEGEGCGVVFELMPGSGGRWTEKVLYSFSNGTVAGGPDGGVTFNKSGDLYVTSFGGGAYLFGAVVQLTRDSHGRWNPHVLHSFTGGEDGANPWGNLVLDSEGSLYGATASGGDRKVCTGLGCGVVFKLSPSGNGQWKEQVLHVFTGGADGASPHSLTLDAAGSLYSTTYSGGHTTCQGPPLGCGVVFKLTRNSDGTWTDTVLHSFTGADGAWPGGGLTLDSKGGLYGSTFGGGTYDWGVFFQLTQ